MGCNASLRSDDVKDGLSNTLLLAEVRIGVNSLDRRGTWAMGSAGAGAVRPLRGQDGGPNVAFPDNLLGAAAIQAAAGGEDELLAEGMPCWDGDGSTKATSASQHAGGVFTCFCDGSVHWLNNNIDHGSNPDLPGTEQAKRSNAPHPNPPTANDYHVWERLNCSADGFPVDQSVF